MLYLVCCVLCALSCAAGAALAQAGPVRDLFASDAIIGKARCVAGPGLLFLGHTKRILAGSFACNSCPKLLYCICMQICHPT